ncbi:hypothetical protein BDV96DRAFT_687883 [Lophiotrema nucula]|uniref:BTB domain-containing protein n=1 Tax=Lophiotrema nucula TaxID=690887 RepID=A0A6A5Z7G9_9PLEO|nr:hypothetical protein BDV96DRAFT_687883 [Lophiotrema nucula]
MSDIKTINTELDKMTLKDEPESSAEVASEPVPLIDVKSSPKVNVESPPLVDIRALSVEDRTKLIEGCQIDIKVDSEAVHQILLRLLLAVSFRAQDLFTQDLAFAVLNVRHGVDKESVTAIFNWLENASSDGAMLLLPKTQDLAIDLKLCRAADQLGMRPYTSHIMRGYWAYFKNRFPDYDEIDVVIDLALGKKDPLILCTAKNLAKRQVSRRIPDWPVFREYVGARPKLRFAM